MKKIYLFFFVILSVSPNLSFADTPIETDLPATSDHYFNGFYFGGGIGAFHVNDNDKNRLSVAPSLTVYEPTEQNKGDYSALLEILSGYGVTIAENFYLGAELFGRYHPIRSDYNYIRYRQKLNDQNYLNYKSQIKLQYSYGVFMRGGYLMTPQTMIYALLGYKYSHFDIQSSVSHRFFQIDVAHGRSSTKINADGVMGGFGIETYLTDQLTFRAQGTYTLHEKFKEKNTYKLDEIFIDEHAHDVRQNTFSLDIIYHLV